MTFSSRYILLVAYNNCMIRLLFEIFHKTSLNRNLYHGICQIQQVHLLSYFHEKFQQTLAMCKAVVT